MVKRGGEEGRKGRKKWTYATRKIDGWFSKLVEKQVGWELHQKVADKEDADGGLVLDRGKIEVALEVGEFGGSDVVSVVWCMCQ